MKKNKENIDDINIFKHLSNCDINTYVNFLRSLNIGNADKITGKTDHGYQKTFDAPEDRGNTAKNMKVSLKIHEGSYHWDIT